MKMRFLIVACALSGCAHAGESSSSNPGGAVSFDGGSQRVAFPVPVYVGAEGRSLSVEGWLLLREMPRPGAVVISQDDGSGGNFKIFMNTDEGPPYLHSAISGDRGTAINKHWLGIAYRQALDVGKWYHFAMTLDRSKPPGVLLKVYLDGKYGREEAHPGPGTWNERLSIGNDVGKAWGGGDWHWRGAIDEVRLYDRVLTPEEIAAHYNGGRGQRGQPEPGLLGGWHFDEGGGTTAMDYSGYGNHGTLENGVRWVSGHVR